MKRAISMLLVLITGVMVMAFYPPVERLEDACEVIKELSSMPDSEAFVELLKRAKGIAVFPNVIKAGFVVGGQYGEGFLLRKDSETGQWYGPLFLKLYKMSYGMQVGAQSIGLVLLIMNDTGFEGFTKDNITLGGSLSIAAGPIGRNLSADIDYSLQTILSYSISKGFFVGFTVEGSVVKIDRKAIEDYYGEYVSPKMILNEKIADSYEVNKLLKLIREITGEGQAL